MFLIGILADDFKEMNDQRNWAILLYLEMTLPAQD